MESDFFCRPSLRMYLEKCEQNIVCKFIRIWSLQSTQLLGIGYITTSEPNVCFLMTDYQSVNDSLWKLKSSTGKHLERPNRSKQHTNKTQLPVGVIQVTNKLLDMNQKTLICNTKHQQLTTS